MDQATPADPTRRVLFTRTGWMGGHADKPTEEVLPGDAETVKVVFDPDVFSFRALLEVFFQTHRSDLDEDVVGSIYRSEILWEEGPEHQDYVKRYPGVLENPLPPPERQLRGAAQPVCGSWNDPLRASRVMVRSLTARRRQIGVPSRHAP